MTHPDAIGGHYPERLDAHRASGTRNGIKAATRRRVDMARLKAKAARERPKTGRKPTCECGECRKCKQREIGRAFESRNPDRKRVMPQPTITENRTVAREPLSTAPDIAFLDRLIASHWGDVPRVLLPECVVAAVEAGQAPPEPSFDVLWAAERSPGSLPVAIAKWAASL